MNGYGQGLSNDRQTAVVPRWVTCAR
jgi:hypothetical protein